MAVFKGISKSEISCGSSGNIESTADSDIADLTAAENMHCSAVDLVDMVRFNMSYITRNNIVIVGIGYNRTVVLAVFVLLAGSR